MQSPLATSRSRAAVPAMLTRLLLTALAVAALAFGFWHAGRFTAHIQAALPLPSPLDGQEGTLLSEARLLLAGEPLYQPLRPDQVIGAPYPPVHYLALAAVEAAFGVKDWQPPVDLPLDTPLPAVFTAGRFVSLAAMLGVALLLGLSVWRLGGSPVVGLITATLWLAFPPVQLWATRIKPDPLALAATAGGLLAIAWYLRPRRSAARQARAGDWLLLLAAACFTLAYFTKQTAVAAPIASGLTLLLLGIANPTPASTNRWNWLRRRISRPLLVFSAAYLGLVSLTWLLLDLLSGGQFTYHVWGLHPPSWWYLSRFLNYATLLLPAWPLMLAALAGGGLALAGVLRGERRPDSGLVFTTCYAALGTLTLLAAGVSGAHHNHLLEPFLALSLAGGTLAGRLVRGTRVAPQWRVPAGLAALALLLLQLGLFVERPAWYRGEFDMQRQDHERYIRLIISQPGEVLADHIGLLVAAGRTPRYNDPATMGPAVRSGLWDDRNLIAEIADRRFSLIILPFDAGATERDGSGRWNPAVIAAVDEHYRVLYRDTLFSYVPR